LTTFLVSRHAGALAWVARRGFAIDRVVHHLDADAIEAGDIVVGTLPLALAACVQERGARVLALVVDVPANARGTELSADALEALGAKLEPFEVRSSSPKPMHLGVNALKMSADPSIEPGVRLPVARYHLTFRMQEGLKLPNFAGSLLRGQFGASLRRLSCVTKAPTCDGCRLTSSCPYSAIFETPSLSPPAPRRFHQPPKPYVIEPPPIGTPAVAAGEDFTFGIVLIGHSLHRLPLIFLALQEALRTGLGRERATGRLQRIEQVGEHGQLQPVWDRQTHRILEHQAVLEVPSFRTCESAQLTIHTPLRLQPDGRRLPLEELTLSRVVAALVRRIELVLEYHAGQPRSMSVAGQIVERATALHEERDLRWHDWTRFSSRQRQPMTLGGIVGTWTLRGDLAPLLAWLWLGQWFHVGKNATMGLGAYRLDLDIADGRRSC
jgi:putative CRISPR-associated protein (TIGR02620 family)